MKKIYAVVKTYNAGYDTEEDEIRKKFELGQTLEIKRIEVGRSSSKVYLKGYNSYFNTVFFTFVNDENKEVDVFSSEEQLIYPIYDMYVDLFKGIDKIEVTVPKNHTTEVSDEKKKESEFLDTLNAQY